MGGGSFFVVMVVINSQGAVACVEDDSSIYKPEGQQDSRDRRMPPEKIMNAIGLKEGMIVGEAGAGDGYFTFKMIKRVGKSGKFTPMTFPADLLID